MDFPKGLTDLIEAFALLPGVGKKTAERFAFFILSKMADEDILKFANSLEKLKASLKKCPICGNLSDEDLCSICLDDERSIEVIMVVEDIKDIFALEKINVFNGIYHVLNGLINLQKGIGPEDINVEGLVKRLEKSEIKEVILATNATTEGEMTARYIKNLISDKNIIVSRIAYGIPVGGDLQYADGLTLTASLQGRIKY